MANTFYTNNFKGRAGRRERAKHIVDEFQAIEDAFTTLQAYNISSYLTIYTHETAQSGTVTIYPDNGYLQEMTLTGDTTIIMAPPLNESQYRVSLLIHGANYKVVNGWGAQTWKEYGGQLDNWWELFTGDGSYASMLLDFWWDICAHTWVCVASSKNVTNVAGGGAAETRFYPLICNLTNTENDDTWGFSRASSGQTIDHNQQYHYLPNNRARHGGVRWVENWCPTASDLTTLAWVPVDCTVTTDAGAGPAAENVQRLSFDVTGGRLGTYILPSFGRAATDNDPIKVAVSFKAKAPDTTTADVRVYAAWCGKLTQVPPVHDVNQMSITDSWQTYGCVLDILKDGNDNKALALDQYYPKTLIEIGFLSPSGSAGDPLLVTDVQIEVLREKDAENVSEIQDTSIGTSIALIGTGTGAWDDGIKTLTLAITGQSVDFSQSLSIGKSYLVHPRLQAGDACDIRMQNNVTVWGAGSPADALYVQDAPFTFQYDGGQLSFVLVEGVSSVYLIDIYEVFNDRKAYCYQNPLTIQEGWDGTPYPSPPPPPEWFLPDIVAEDETKVPFSSGVLFGTAREIASTNVIPYQYFRTFTVWDQVGLSGVDVNNCRNPVFQSEYGIDGWPSRATILQGASRVTDGYIQREWSMTPTVGGNDFQIWIRRTLDVEGNQIYEPQAADVNVPVSRYVDFEAELLGGTSVIESGRIRLDIQAVSFVGQPSGYNYSLGIFVIDDWYFVNISLQNDGTHDTYRVRVYPSSADDPDPTVVDVTHQGWAVVDWAQFEVTAGSFRASSPMIGGETRAIENFTTALPDGEVFGTYEDGSFLDEPNKKVADVTSGNIIWLQDDYVWRYLLYSTTGMGGMSVYNMHEFGLVDNQTPPQNNLQVLTTTLFPLYVADGASFAIDLDYGSMNAIPQEATFYQEGTTLSGELNTILLSTSVTGDDMYQEGTALSGVLYTILLSVSVTGDDMYQEGTTLSGALENKLVTAYSPDSLVYFGCDLDPSGCSMTPV